MLKKSTIIGKATLAERISENLKRSKKINLNKTQIEEMINKLLEEIENSLLKGEEIRFQNYFSLKTTMAKARMAMNLKTKKKMVIPAKNTPKAKFSDTLKKAIASKKIVKR